MIGDQAMTEWVEWYEATVEGADNAPWGMDLRAVCPHAEDDECARCDADAPAWGRCHYAPAPAEQYRFEFEY